MADSDALRQRRRRQHNAGDHSLCTARCRNPKGFSKQPGYISPSKQRPCSICGKTLHIGRTSLAQPTCRECRRKRPKNPPWIYQCDPLSFASHECEDCGSDLRRHERPTCADCSVARRRERARSRVQGTKNRERRQRLHGECYDGVKDREIFERDRWMCWICKKRIGEKVKYPNTRCASVDHVVPLSLGGDDTALNKRAAHLVCNIKRGNKIDQMPLFGYAVDFVPVVKVKAEPDRRRCSCGAESLRGRRSWCADCRTHIAAAASAMRDAGLMFKEISAELDLGGPGFTHTLIAEFRLRARSGTE